MKSILGFYFFRSIFFSPEKQFVLIISSLGLALGAFALLFLQSTMGGLQRNLIERSKRVHGHSFIEVEKLSTRERQELENDLKQLNIPFAIELEQEVLLQSGGAYRAIVLRAMAPTGHIPDFLSSPQMDLVMGYYLASELGLVPGMRVNIISPTNMATLLAEIPRSMEITYQESVLTQVPDVDSAYAWVRLSFLQNLIRELKVSHLRLFAPFPYQAFKADFNFKYGEKIKITTWEEKQKTLLMAFALENRTLLLLFSMTTVLMSLSIMAGLSLLFNRLYPDLTGLWILGMTPQAIKNQCWLLIILLCLTSVLTGLGLSYLGLWALDHYAPTIMPPVFVDRQIPVSFNLKQWSISFLVPFLVGILGGWLALRNFFKRPDLFSRALKSA